MSEENQAETTETGAEAEQQQSETTEQKPKPTETVEFWKQKAREQEARAKANAEAAKKLQEFEDRDKSEAQKLAERVEAAENRTRELEAQSMRLEVASEKGLSPAQAKRLVGATREELEADADELLETFKPTKSDDGTEAVVTSLDLGTRGTSSSTAGDPAADFAKFLQRELR